MNSNHNKKTSLLVDGSDQAQDLSHQHDNARSSLERFKKPIIFALMAVVFAGCMYLIFKPSVSNKKLADIGLNDAVPQATDAGLQSDKQKAYEQEKMDRRAEEKRNMLTSLSDYLSADTSSVITDRQIEEEKEAGIPAGMHARENGNTIVKSYKNAQDALNNFYHEDRSENRALQKEIDELKQQLAEKHEDAPSSAVENQLELMEKSYQMAAKYLPQGTVAVEQSKLPEVTKPGTDSSKNNFVSFTPARKSVVSKLYQRFSDSLICATGAEKVNERFYTTGVTEDVIQLRNSIRAYILENTVVFGEGIVKLRLLEGARTPRINIEAGSTITSHAKFQNGRLELSVSTIEVKGNIVSVALTGYDLDGQPGLFVPYTPEMNAIKDIAANMSQSAGTSIMMASSTGQQLTGDLTRGMIQGVSGYLSKKIRTPKVTLKAGVQVLLVSK